MINKMNSMFYSKGGVTPLHLAVEVSASKVVTALIRGGADLNIQDHVSKGGWIFALHLFNMSRA